MSFQIEKGDLFNPMWEFDALAQGVNCQGKMGAGIAVEFRTRHPQMFAEYKKLCDKHKDILPGLIHVYNPFPTMVPEYAPEGSDGPYDVTIDFGTTIYNLFTQVMPGKNGDYKLLKSSALLMLMDAEAQEFDSVGLPWIGCGIAGLEKHNVEHILHEILDESSVQFVLVEQ